MKYSKIITCTLALFIAVCQSSADATKDIATNNDVERISIELKPKGEAKLKEFDSLLSLSNEQYNAIALMIKQREFEWNELYSQKKSMPEADYKKGKKKITKKFDKNLAKVLTPEQLSNWKNRQK